jgi:hypothetical protein
VQPYAANQGPPWQVRIRSCRPRPDPGGRKHDLAVRQRCLPLQRGDKLPKQSPLSGPRVVVNSRRGTLITEVLRFGDKPRSARIRTAAQYSAVQPHPKHRGGARGREIPSQPVESWRPALVPPTATHSSHLHHRGSTSR